MPRSANILILASMVLLFGAGYFVAVVPRLAASRAVTVLLAVQNAAVAALAALAVAHRSWWDLLTAGIFAAGSIVLWEMHRAARKRRPSRLVWRLLNRHLAPSRGGRRLWTIAELRAEYAQTILDDAERDPELAAILEEFGGRIAAESEKQDDMPPGGQVALLTAYANGYLDSLSEPGRQPSTRGYRGYSTDMLMVAAVCAAADRLGAR